jgi:hypothetical protein
VGVVRYVYVAGPLSGYPGDYLANVARMSRYSRQLIEAGDCPINPAADILEGLASARPLTIAQYHARSMDLLRLLAGRDDAEMHVLSLSHRDGVISDGVLDEVGECGRLGIPVVYV